MKAIPTSHPPRKRKWYFKVEYKNSAIKLEEGQLRLSHGRGNAPLYLPWPWDLPQTVVIHWTGTEYEAIATYKHEVQGQPQGDKVAGIDLGEIHMAVSHDGEQTHILNGRHLRSKRQYRNKLLEKLNKQIERKKKGSIRRKSKPQGRVFHCTNKQCRFTWHRDGVGACNIRRKYLDCGPVVGGMAPPTGMRFTPHARVARREKAYLREAALLQ